MKKRKKRPMPGLGLAGDGDDKMCAESYVDSMRMLTCLFFQFDRRRRSMLMIITLCRYAIKEKGLKND